MTEQLAHRDLRNRSAEILRNVAAGASYEITNHGEVVALLIPAGSGERLALRRATIRGGFEDIVSVRRDESTQAALDDLRGDR
ncbi:MAG: type II toxin-antitoxin system Phd/YefM family antitoxin [Sporichthyaceae bacterium]